MEHASFAQNYQRRKTADGRYYFNILDENSDIIARRIEYFVTEAIRDKAIVQLINQVHDSREACEGLHLVEHILLRPKTPGDPLFSVCVPKDCNTCSGLMDPYSFRASIILPGWLPRLFNLDYRRYFERTLRAEAPAHVHLKICWVSREDMQRFETEYFPWLSEQAKKSPDLNTLSTRKLRLIQALESIHNLYPETRLYSCEQEQNSILLDSSVLGEE